MVVSRNPAYDTLRAAMMLLGIILHTTMSYTTYTEGIFAYFFHDASRSRICDIFLFWVHTFRMPVFYVMAGYFAAYIYRTKGTKGFIKNRLSRVLCPFIVFWIILNPVFRFADNFQSDAALKGISVALQEALVQLIRSPYGTGLIHLWFLYYLILFYALFLTLTHLPQSFRANIKNVFNRVMNLRLSWLIFSLFTIAVMTLMDTGTFDTPKRFFPIHLPVFTVYFYFFCFGALFSQYPARDTIFKKDTLALLLLSLLVFAIHFHLLDKVIVSSYVSDSLYILCTSTAALVSWMLVYGFTGLAQRYITFPNKVVSYMSDASYWMYLLHLPLVLVGIGMLSLVTLPALLKCAIVVVGVFILLLVSYHYGVRGKFIGKFLGEKTNKP